MKKKRILILSLVIVVIVAALVYFFVIKKNRKKDTNKLNEYETQEYIPLKENETRADGDYILEDFIERETYDSDIEGRVEVLCPSDMDITDCLLTVSNNYEKVETYFTLYEDFNKSLAERLNPIEIAILDKENFKENLHSGLFDEYEAFKGTNLCFIGSGIKRIGITREAQYLCEQNNVDISGYDLIIYDFEKDLVTAYYNKEIEGYIGTGEYDEFSAREILLYADYYVVRVKDDTEYEEGVPTPNLALGAIYNQLKLLAEKTIVPYYVIYTDEVLLKYYNSLADVPAYIIGERTKLGMDLPKFDQ